MPLGEEFSNTLVVTVAGTPLPADVVPLLVDGYVDDSTNVPDLFVLRFNDEGGTVLTKGGFKIGAAVQLSLQSTAPGGPDPLLIGEVTALEVEVGPAGVHTVVRGLDKSHRLFRGTRVEAYPNMTASDIVRKVAQRAGLEAKVDATTEQLDHVTQGGESDWDFLRRLAAENERVLAVVGTRLEFLRRTEAGQAPGGSGDSRQNPLVLERGVNLVRLRGTVTSQGQVPEVEVRGWDPEQKKEVVASKPAATGSAELDGVTPKGLADEFSSPPYVAGAATMTTQAACAAAASSLADHLAGGFAELSGTARGNPGLRAGTAVQLVGVGTPFNGKYTISASRHVFSAQLGYQTEFTVSNTSERSLYGAAHGPDRAGGGRTSGVVPAVVSSVHDPEERGRVKVRFPWLSESYESWWARPVLPGAGSERGLTVLPEVNDEVLVAFAQGDLGTPYVLGGLYNGKDQAKPGWGEFVDGTDGSVVRRSWVGRTGMRIDLVESPSEEKLVVSTNDGAQHLTLQQRDKGIEVVSEGPVSVTAQQDVSVSTSSGTVSLKGASITVEATGSLELKGADVKVTGSATAELSAQATTTIRGGLVRIN